MTTATTLGRRGTAGLLALLCLAAVALRLYGLDAMLPHAKEPDAHIAQQADLLAGAAGPSDKLEKYPHLLARAVVLLRAVRPTSALPADADLPEHLARAARPILDVRLVVAWIALLAVPAAYFLARTWLGPGASLAAAALTLFSLLLQSLSQQARPHAPLATLTALAVLASLRMRRRPSAASYALAGGAAGLAVGCLQNGVFAVLSVAAAHFLREGPRRWRDHLRVGAALLPFAAALVAFYPFFFFGRPESPPPGGPATDAAPVEPGPGPGPGPARAGAPAEPEPDVRVSEFGIRHGQHYIVWRRFDGSGTRRVLWHLWSYEPALLVLAAVGLAVALRRAPRALRDGPARRDLLVVLSCAGSYLLLLCAYRSTLARYLVPLVPFLACLGAAGVAAVARAARAAAPRRLRAAAGPAAVAAALALPAYATVRLARVRAAPDTIERTTAWLSERVVPGMRVFHGMNLDLPLAPDPESLAANRLEEDRFQVGPWMDYLFALPEPLPGPDWSLRRMPASDAFDRWRLRENMLGYVHSLDAHIVVLLVRPRHREQGRGHRRAAPEDGSVTTERFQEALSRAGFLVARFTSAGEQKEGGESFDFEYAAARLPSFTGQVLRARSMGPIVEVYRMNR